MSVSISCGCMEVNGNRSFLFSGEVEYWRLNPKYWEVVLDRLIETGMEWVSSYVPWRVHEQGRHDYDLEGKTNPRLNLRAYLELIREKGLKMYFRPGPLIVSEMAAGGYPQWLVEEDPLRLVWDADNKIPPGFQGYGGVPCYLHPDYLEHVAVWLSAVNDIACDFLAPAGPIAIYQLDNEVSLVCKDGMFQSDYNPHIVGPGGVYHQWLREKYGSFEAIPYGEDCEDIGEIAPPRDLELWGERRVDWWWDWAEFKEYYLARYLEELRKIHEGCGVTEVKFCTNFNPHRPNTVPNNWKKYEEATRGLVGYDFYRSPFLSYTGYLSLSRISRMLGSWMELPWSAEFMSGFWHEDFNNGGYPFAEHHEMMSYAALANGLKALSWYMFHDRERWGGAPVSNLGQKRYAHNAICEVMNFVEGCKDFSSLQLQGRVGVLYYRPYHIHTFLGDSMPCNDSQVHIGQPEIDGVKAGLTSTEYEAIFGILMDAGYSPIPVDPAINSEELDRLDALWATTQTFMDPETASQLWEFARKGGVLIIGPYVPEASLSGDPLALPEGLGEADPVCRGQTNIKWYDTSVTFYEGLWSLPGESIVSLGNQPIVSGHALGEGVVIFVGGYIAQDLSGPAPEGNVEFAGRLLEFCEISPRVKTNRRDIHAILQTNDQEGYLFLLNLGLRARSAKVSFQHNAPRALKDAQTGEEIQLADAEARVDVDCKRCRVMELI
ncbi:MAG: beta-galactosidase [Planctomycetes bacterium]|nr:beta-galactosidase [Planctomycetota bacterium]